MHFASLSIDIFVLHSILFEILVSEIVVIVHMCRSLSLGNNQFILSFLISLYFGLLEPARSFQSRQP